MNILTGRIAHTQILLAADKGGDTGSAPAGNPTTFTVAHPIVETTMIELKKLVIDAGTQPRVAIDDGATKEYTETIKLAIKEEQPNPFSSLPDSELPQVFRDSTGRCVLADGFHRYISHKQAHEKEMKVAIREGTERDALIYSLGANARHGVQRTNKDKMRAVKIAFSDPELVQLPNTEIARICGVSEFFVREHKPAASTPTTKVVKRKGKTIKMDTSGIGKGKGAGKKGAAAKAKKDGKPAKPGKTASSANKTVAEQMHREVTKINNTIGGDAGKKIEAAICDGSLGLSARDLKDWAGLTPKNLIAIAPLVTGGSRMKPFKAYEFITSELPEKIVTELHLRALGAGGTYEFKDKDSGITVTVTAKK